MAHLIKITCNVCQHSWEEDYDRLCERRPIYRSATKPGQRQEEYMVRCPNPRHGEEIVVTIQVEDRP